MVDYVSFRALYRKCVRGLGYTLGDPAQGQFLERVADVMSDAIARVWRAAQWPQLMLWEKRVYRRPWEMGIVWRLGHECYFGGKYYEAMVDGPSEVPGEGEQWRELGKGEMAKFIALDQPWESHEIGLSGIDLGHFAFDGDPRYGKAKVIAGCQWMGDFPGGGTTRVLLPESAPNEVTVCYLPKVPRVDGEWFDASATYFYGDVVYDGASGECYRCTVKEASGAITAEAWEKVRIPQFMAGVIKAYVKSEFMEDEQGRATTRKRFEDELARLKEDMVGATGAFDEAAIDLGD